MRYDNINIADVVVFSLPHFTDARGINAFPFQASMVSEAIGRNFLVAQVNATYTLPGTFRGIHYALVPPGQAKYIFATSGSCIDFLVDLRVGSPTFLQIAKIPLIAYPHSTSDVTAIYIPEGIGHGIHAADEAAQITYLCSQEYNPENERGITPLDPALNLALEVDSLVLSAKDRAASQLADAQLPSYHVCQQWYRQ